MTGLNLELTMQRIYTWEAWTTHGWTREDLRVCIRYLKGRIRERVRQPECLKFRNLIERPDIFEEELSMAHALSRRPKPNPEKDATLKGTGRQESAAPLARSAAEIMAGDEALRKFKELGERL